MHSMGTHCGRSFQDANELARRAHLPGGLRDLQFSRRVEAQRAEVLLSRNPQQFLVHESPEDGKPWGQVLIQFLGNVRGQRILQVGCSLGQFAVYLAQQGASVTASEACPEALQIAQRIAEINGVHISFQHASPDQVEVPAGTMDLVFGLPTLHHLSRPDVQMTFRKTHAALRIGGRAVFVEGVESSPLFSFLQNLVSVGKPSDEKYRPSILFRERWKQWMDRQEERDMHLSEFYEGAGLFRRMHIHPLGLVSRLDRFAIMRRRCLLRLMDKFDAAALARFPSFSRYARTMLVEYVK